MTVKRPTKIGVNVNTLLAQKVLAEKEWLNRMQPEDFRGLTPLFYGHINPYGVVQTFVSPGAIG